MKHTSFESNVFKKCNKSTRFRAITRSFLFTLLNLPLVSLTLKTNAEATYDRERAWLIRRTGKGKGRDETHNYFKIRCSAFLSQRFPAVRHYG